MKLSKKECVIGKSILGGAVLGVSVWLVIEFWCWVIGRLG